MAQIFISYRRADSQAITDHIYKRLTNAFGQSAVFKDVDNIAPGEDFPNYLVESLRSASVVLVVIGQRWATLPAKSGKPRLFYKKDFVRLEVEAALRLKRVRAIPVLVNGATMPDAEQLPKPLQGLTRLNAVNVRNDPDFDRDMQRLIRKLQNAGVKREGLSPRLIVAVAALVVLVSFVLGGFLLLRSNGSDDEAVAQAMTQTAAMWTPTEPVATGVPAIYAIVVATGDVPVRLEPGDSNQRIATLSQGEQVRVLGRSDDGEWLNVELESGEIGWISAELISPIDVPLPNDLTATQQATEPVIGPPTLPPSWTPEPSFTPLPSRTPLPTVAPTPTLSPEMAESFIVYEARVEAQPANPDIVKMVQFADLEAGVQIDDMQFSRFHQLLASRTEILVSSGSSIYGAELQLVNLDNDSRQTLTDFQNIAAVQDSYGPSSVITQAKISPDGQILAFVVQHTGGPSNILFLQSVDGGVPVRVDGVDSDNVKMFETFEWSPDSSSIAFVLSSGLYVVDSANPVGTSFIQDGSLASQIGRVNSIAWSPDGTRLAFVASQSDGGRSQLLVIANVNPNRSIGTYTVWDDVGGVVSWSPDGRYVTAALPSGEDWLPAILDGSSDEPPRILADVMVTYYEQLRWSPDGSRLLFVGEVDDQNDIFVVNRDGSELRNLTNHPADDGWLGGYVWSPDGAYIAFTTDRDGDWELYIMDSNGGSLRNISNDPLASDLRPAWH